MTEYPSERFAGILKIYEHGEPLTTSDLTWFIKEAEKVIQLLYGVPAYELMVRDLQAKVNQFISFLAARKLPGVG